MDIDLQDMVREVEAEFARYDAALMANDLQTLDALFWPDERTVRYGVAEALYGIEGDSELPPRPDRDRPRADTPPDGDHGVRA